MQLLSQQEPDRPLHELDSLGARLSTRVPGIMPGDEITRPWGRGRTIDLVCAAHSAALNKHACFASTTSFPLRAVVCCCSTSGGILRGSPPAHREIVLQGVAYCSCLRWHGARMAMELENIVANTVYIKAREGERSNYIYCIYIHIWVIRVTDLGPSVVPYLLT